MKPLIALALVGLAATCVSLAVSREAPDRPPGISADHWAPISSTLGVVLVPDLEPSALPPLPVGAAGPPPANNAARSPDVAPIADMTGLYAAPSAAVQAVIEEGFPVRGYIMVKRGKVWRPLTVVAPTVNN